ncbi:RNA polymerase subunit sigma-24 [Fulvitalea axinellae]|uniref:RNA polymerase subunit sigma-24 n=1 Tax=Fulvitalea axinellae TaxID=1182444 RepID=A0AAU9CQZ9_9BACT|nr:RNA polymerase subunit sigma-24 [Fulvitalea axinellae]
MSISANIHEDLIQGCLRNDERARRKLYQQYAPGMYNVCKRMVNDEDDAKDVLQEVFISAFSNIGNYRGDATFGAWIKRIAVNKSINFLNRKRAELVPLGDSDPADQSAYDEDGDKWSVETVRSALRKLPDGFRVVVSLYLFEGYDHQEIGEILGISPSTSKTQYMRGKKKLLNLLQDEIPQ